MSAVAAVVDDSVTTLLISVGVTVADNCDVISVRVTVVDNSGVISVMITAVNCSCLICL